MRGIPVAGDCRHRGFYTSDSKTCFELKGDHAFYGPHAEAEKAALPINFSGDLESSWDAAPVLLGTLRIERCDRSSCERAVHGLNEPPIRTLGEHGRYRDSEELSMMRMRICMSGRDTHPVPRCGPRHRFYCSFIADCVSDRISRPACQTSCFSHSFASLCKSPQHPLEPGARWNRVLEESGAAVTLHDTEVMSPD